MDVLLQERLGVLVGAGHRHAGGARFGVGVPHQRAELLEHAALDGRVEAAAGGPVRVEQRLLAAGAPEGVVQADDALAKRGKCLVEWISG